MLERIEKIEAQLRLWGISNLTPQGEIDWTKDICWLMEQSLKAYKYELALKKIVKIGNQTFKTESEIIAEKALNADIQFKN